MGMVNFLGLGCVGDSPVCDSHVIAVVLYKLEGKGFGVPNPSGVKKLAQISSLRFQSRLECQVLVWRGGRLAVSGVMPYL